MDKLQNYTLAIYNSNTCNSKILQKVWRDRTHRFLQAGKSTHFCLLHSLVLVQRVAVLLQRRANQRIGLCSKDAFRTT